MRVSHVSTHVALQDVAKRLTRSACATSSTSPTRLCAALVERPKIAVAALNPHAGEGALFGRQDIGLSEPTIASAVAD